MRDEAASPRLFLVSCYCNPSIQNTYDFSIVLCERLSLEISFPKHLESSILSACTDFVT